MTDTSSMISSPIQGSFTGISGSGRSASLRDDPSRFELTSFNPFSEEDSEQSSYQFMNSLFNRVKNSLSVPLSNATTSSAPLANSALNNPRSPNPNQSTEPKRPLGIPHRLSNASSKTGGRPAKLNVKLNNPAPPLVSINPVVSEAPSLSTDYDNSPPKAGISHAPLYEWQDGQFGTAIPGFPIPDDARSIRTTMSLQRSASVSKVIRRIRGEGLSRDYWMDDELCKECYDCKSIFTTWRRKHHCRICGQIFCSRCASNIISGMRFGHDGMLRVCNICLNQVAKVDEEDEEDDRRSVVSGMTSSFPGPGVHHLAPDSLTRRLGYQPNSPFSASQLFGRGDEPFTLFSIAEAKRALSGGSDGSSPFNSRAGSPDGDLGEDHFGITIRGPAVPFRRGLAADNDKDASGAILVPGSDGAKSDNSHIGSANQKQMAMSPLLKTSIEFPKTISIATEGLSSVQFPVTSPDQPYAFDTPTTGAYSRSRYSSLADMEVPTPFIRSRVQSRLMDGTTVGEPGWRTRRESTAYAKELNFISMSHLRIMLKQMLTNEGIPNVAEWEETLLKLALRIAKEMTFTAFPQRQGEDMDVRRYVKIKKIPGGSPSDSEYVDGAVITKNAAHKQMARTLRHPRIMLVTFPLEFARVEGQYLQFAQILRQEREYLHNLASRIAALRPHVLLVEKSVSRVALEELSKHPIVVARSVKPSAIALVARTTQGGVVSSLDKLLEPHFGHCQRFRIQTFDHPLIPGRRKTYMRFEGCNPSMGCTILLRGGSNDTLTRVKKITRLLSFIVRNLKLETHLWKDSVISLPTLSAHAAPTAYIETLENAENEVVSSKSDISRRSSHTRLTSEGSGSTESEYDLPNEDAEQKQLSRRIQSSLDPYLSTFISASATLRFPPPHPIKRMKELDDKLARDRRAWEDEIINREEKGRSRHSREETIIANSWSSSPSVSTPSDSSSGSNIGVSSVLSTAMPTPTPFSSLASVTTDHADIRALIEQLPGPGSLQTLSPDAESPTSTSNINYFDRPVSSTPASTSIDDTPSEELPFQLKTVSDITLESQLGYTKWLHAEQRRIWEWYLRKNQDDFVVEKYQCITLWEGTVPISEYGQRRLCFTPQMKYITFYGDNDCTLGKFIEKSVYDTTIQILDQKALCPAPGCNKPMAQHCTVFTHNEMRLFVAIEQWDGQIKGHTHFLPTSDMITTWSLCRVCNSATPFIPVSEEMQRYSFAKFLELHFYPANVELVPGAGCQHNIYQHHIRYFAYRGMTVRFQADPIVIHEVVYPPMRIRIRPETLLELKNSDYERIMKKFTVWHSELIDELRSINIEAATGDEEFDTHLTLNINNLITKAEAEQVEFTNVLNKTYRESLPWDTLALNQVRAYCQDKLVAWQEEFDNLPRPKSHGTERGGGRRTSALGSIRVPWGRGSGFYHEYNPSTAASETEDNANLSFPLRRAAKGLGVSVEESASEASEPETGKECTPEKDPSPSTTLSNPMPMSDASELPHVDNQHPINDVTNLTETASEDVVGAAISPAPIRGEIVTTDHAPAATTDVSVGAALESDDDSDSTIGAAQQVTTQIDETLPTLELPPSTGRRPLLAPSRLPRRVVQQPSVADLVKRYQEYIPPQGLQELARTALAPNYNNAMSESEQEYGNKAAGSKPVRSKRHNPVARKTSISDFEQSYAANVAPRNLTQKGRPPSAWQGRTFRRLGMTTPSMESLRPPRIVSPERQASSFVAEGTTEASDATSPSGSRSTAVTFKTPKGKMPNRFSKDRLVSGGSRPNTAGGSKPPLRRPPPVTGNKVGTITKQFEKIGRENDRMQKRYSVIRGRRPRPVATARAKVQVLDSVKDAIKDESESDASSEADDEGEEDEESRKPVEEQTIDQDVAPATEAVAEGKPTEDTPPIEVKPQELPPNSEVAAPAPTPVVPTTFQEAIPPSVPPSPFLALASIPGLRHHSSEVDLGERHSILRALSGFLGQQTFHRSRDHDVDDPMADPEHIFRDSSMVVRTDEPTSIIALALNSPQYRDMLAKSRADKRQAKEPRIATDSGEAFMPDDNSIAESSSTWGVVNVEVNENANPTEDMRVPSSKLPWQITFDSGGLTISCTVLYPEQFDALRRTYDCDKSMVESLARCIKWDASGGKSGSAFLKTRDQRFIAKELSRSELQTMASFAPAYFDYMSSAVTSNRPTLLAKIFGCYKITFKKTDENGSKSKVTQMNLLVMENLFYDRRFSRIYDLKGSTRNRRVHSTGRENEVLLDENLVELSQVTPYYLREHSKRILRGALYSDTKFLADVRVNVMDYSLVVGIDDEHHEMVVGIVDYIRTYTWDKKLESWVKDSAFLGTGKGDPTIITPKQYRHRFLAAMERYFPLVPDRWMKQKDVQEDDNVHGWRSEW